MVEAGIQQVDVGHGFTGRVVHGQRQELAEVSWRAADLQFGALLAIHGLKVVHERPDTRHRELARALERQLVGAARQHEAEIGAADTGHTR